MTSFLRPRSVAIIGASRDPKKIGHTILSNILSAGFKGKLYPVNPHATKIRGLRAYPSVTSIQRSVELAIIVIPAPLVAQELIACGKKGIRAVIVISAGFEEIGGGGVVRDTPIRTICRR